MSKTFVTSDTHFFHKRILEFCPKTRPFTDVDQMNRAIINAWNETVSENDTVYHLGDVSFSGKGKTLGILQALKGRKILVKGNHDHRRCYTLNIWDSVYDMYNLKFEGHLFILCHYPIEDWAWKAKGTFHLHGHTHGGTSKHGGGLTKIPNRFDVGLDSHLCENLKPINIERFV